MSLTNIALNSRSMNGQIVLSDGVATISEGNIDCEDINSANLSADNINTNLLNVTGKLECNSAGPYNIPISISSVTGLLIGYGHVTNSGATDFLNFQSTYTSTQGGFRFWNKSSTQTLTNLAIIDNTQTFFSSQLTGCLAESPVSASSVVNRSYVDNNFVDKTTGQTISGLKLFLNNLEVYNISNPSLILRTSSGTSQQSTISQNGSSLQFLNNSTTPNITYLISGTTRLTISPTQFLLDATCFLTTNDIKSRAPTSTHTLLSDITTGSLSINSITGSNIINGSSSFTNNCNFKGSLLARTNITLYEWDNQTGNTLILTFPMKQTIALRVSSGTTMSVQLPALTTNERGMVFTFIKLSSNVNVTLSTGGLNNIYTLNDLGTNTTTNTTLLSAEKIMTTLAVGFFGALTYWIEVSPYSTFDRDQNNLLYARLASPNAFTNTNTFNSFLPTSTLTPSSDTQLITKIFADQTYINFTTNQDIPGNKNFTNITSTRVLYTKDFRWYDAAGGGNIQQIYLTGITLAYVPLFNNNQYSFQCRDNSSTTTTPLTIDSASTTIANNLISNGQATFNNLVHLKSTTRIYDLITPFTNYTSFYTSGNASVIYAGFAGSSVQFYCRTAGNLDVQTFYSFATANTSVVPFIASSTATFNSSLITNNLTSPTTTSTNNIYTNLIAGGSINIGSLSSTNVIAGNTAFSSDITTQNIFCDTALYLNDYQPLPSPTTYSSILVQNSDILNFDANFLLNKFQFLVSSNAVLLLDATNTTIYNNLISNSQATFNNFTPICSVSSPTANNHLVRKDYCDNNFMSLTVSQTKSGTVNFLNRITFNGGSGGGTAIDCNNGLNANTFLNVAGQANMNGDVYSNTTIFVKDLSWKDIQSPFTNRIQSYLNSDALIFFPQFNLNRYAFITKDVVGNQINAILITNASTTIGNNLVSNNLTSLTSTSTNNIYTSLGSGGSINIGGALGTNNIYGSTTFNSSSTFNVGVSFLGISSFNNGGTFTEIEQTSGSNLVIRNTTNSKKIILSTTSASTGQVDSLVINTTSCDILSPTLNLNSSSTINILTPNNLTGVINFLNTLTTATINFCSTAYTSIFNLNARLAHKGVQYMNEVKTISGTSATLAFPLEQSWMFTSTGATQVVITLPEITASHQAGFNFIIFKTASNTNSVLFNRSGSNTIRGLNSITDVTSVTRLSGTNSVGVGFYTAEVSTGNFAWISY